MNIKTARRIDHLVGTPLCWAFNLTARILGILLRRDHSFSEAPKKILIIKLMGMGSIVEAFALLKGIKATYPQSSISFLSFTENEPLLQRLTEVDHIYLLKDKDIWLLGWSVLKVLIVFWRERFDLTLDLEVYAKFSTLLASLTLAKNRIGFFLVNTWFRRNLHSHLIYFNRFKHVSELYKELGRVLELNVLDDHIPGLITLTEADNLEFDRLMEKESLQGKEYVLINPNASDLCLERRWPGENFAKVGKYILSRTDLEVIFVGSPGERDYVRSCLAGEEFPKKVHNFAGLLSFGGFLKLIQEAKALITNDSGPLHLAAAFNVPTLSFWGPGTPHHYAPKGDKHIYCFSDVVCSPCLYMTDYPPCQGDNICMKRLTLAEALQKLPLVSVS